MYTLKTGCLPAKHIILPGASTAAAISFVVTGHEGVTDSREFSVHPINGSKATQNPGRFCFSSVVFALYACVLWMVTGCTCLSFLWFFPSPFGPVGSLWGGLWSPGDVLRALQRFIAKCVFIYISECIWGYLGFIPGVPKVKWDAGAAIGNRHEYIVFSLCLGGLYCGGLSQSNIIHWRPSNECFP